VFVDSLLLVMLLFDK